MTQPLSEQLPLNHFDYFSEIEEAFVRHRGTHLLLSPKDWALIALWQESRIPLHVVLSGIETAFNRHSRSRKLQSINSLSYCRGEVEKSFADWLKNQVGQNNSITNGDTESKVRGDGATQAFSHAEILRHLAACQTSMLTALGGLSSEGSLARSLRSTAYRLERLRQDFEQVMEPDFNGLESALLDLEQSLDQTLLDHLPSDQSTAWRVEVESHLVSHRNHVKTAEYESMIGSLLLKRLRESLGIPRLSLFSL
jgi:hypothetical protein